MVAPEVIARGPLAELDAISVLAFPHSTAVAGSFVGGWNEGGSPGSVAAIVGDSWLRLVDELGISAGDFVRDAFESEPEHDTNEVMPSLSDVGFRRDFGWSHLDGFVEPAVAPAPAWIGFRRWCEETAPLVIGRHRDGGYAAWDRDAGGTPVQRWAEFLEYLEGGRRLIDESIVQPAVLRVQLNPLRRSYRLVETSQARVGALVCEGTDGEFALVICDAAATITRYAIDPGFAFYASRSASAPPAHLCTENGMFPNHFECRCDAWEQFSALAEFELRSTYGDRQFIAVPPDVDASLLETAEYVRAELGIAGQR